MSDKFKDWPSRVDDLTMDQQMEIVKEFIKRQTGQDVEINLLKRCPPGHPFSEIFYDQELQALRFAAICALNHYKNNHGEKKA